EAQTTPAIYVQDENARRATDAESRGIGGMSSQPISEPGEATLIGPPAEPTTAGLTEVLHSNDAEKATITDSPQEPSAPNSTDFKRKDTAKDRLVKFVKALKRAANARRSGSSETLDQPPNSPTKVTTRVISSSAESSPPEQPSEAFHSKNANKERLVAILEAFERSADTNRRG